MKNTILVIFLNVLCCSVVGFLTLDPRNNFLSAIGAILFSILISYIISQRTAKFNTSKKILFFGFSLIVYLLLAIVKLGVTPLTSNGFIISVILFNLILLLNKPKGNMIN